MKCALSTSLRGFILSNNKKYSSLQKVTDKQGIHLARDLSGNVSMKKIFRYAKLSQGGHRKS